MKLTDDQRIQIFCTTLNAVIQTHTDLRIGTLPKNIAEKSSSYALEAIRVLEDDPAWQSK